jgi:hypothetical protein
VVAGEVVRDERGEEADVEEVLNAEDDHGDGEEEAAGHEGVFASGGEAVEDERGGGEGEALEEEGAAVGVVGDVVDVDEVEAEVPRKTRPRMKLRCGGAPGGEESEAGGDAEGGEGVGDDHVGVQPGGAEGEAAAEMSVDGVLDAEAEEGEGVEDAADGGEGMKEDLGMV